MKYGLTDEQCNILKKILIDPLRRLGAELWVFGSRARLDHKKFSDLDILVSSNDPLVRKYVAEISEALVESSFPYKVEIVHLDDLALSYRANVMKDRVLLEL